MDGGLRMHSDLHLRGGQVEEAACLDDLESFVQHRRRVDGDALAHDPCRVLERLRRRDVFELGEWCVAERAARGGEPDLADLARLASAEALVDGVVLAVDGQEAYAAFAGGGQDEIAGSDEALLVGEPDGLTGEHRGVGGLESGDTDDGGDDEAGLGERGDADGACGAVDDLSGDSGGLQASAKLVGEALGGDGDESRVPALALFEGDIKVRASGKSDGLEAIRIRLTDAEG